MDRSTLFSQLDQKEREKAQCRYIIIEPYISKKISLKKLARENDISLRTLTLWVRKYKTQGLIGLVRQPRNDKGTLRKFGVDTQKIVEGVYFSQPKSTYSNIYKLVAAYCEQKQVASPSYKTVCNIINNIPDNLITLNNEGTKAYQQKYDLLHIRSANIANELWQADHVLLDIEVLNAHNKPQKPWLTIIIDDCSRAICGYELSFLSPSALKTSLCLRHAIWRKADPKWEIFGIPSTLYTDHGSDFTSKHIEQICTDLKIKLIFSQVGQPRGRGKIERFFRTLNQLLISTLDRTGYSKGFNLKQLNSLIYRFIVEYNYTEHSETGTTPIERWQKDGFLPQVPESLEQLDLLLLTDAKPRKILRDGIHFQGLRYFDLALAEYVGENVVIRYIPSDITSIRVFHNDRFLCQPICTELSNATISIKEIQYVRNKRRRELKEKIKTRKSLVEAVIAASRTNSPFTDEEEPLLMTKEKQQKLRLFKNE